ncbi:MAG: zinc-dependent alcohol dehydrogenase [Dermatophilaceae bacterium]
MRELTYTGVREVAWREVAEPTIEGPFDAVVRPVAATTCDVDKSILTGRVPVPAPYALGHECVAQVVDVGSGVTHVAPGDLVVVPWHIACGRCDRCHDGLYVHCRAVPHMAMFGVPLGGEWGGLFSDLVKVPWADAMLVPLPAGLDPVAMASAGDNWPLAWRLVVPHLRSRPGAHVLVVSGGSIGLYVADIARASGAGRVLYVDPSADRRAVAASYGAEVIDAYDPAHEFDISVESTGRTAGLVTALRSLTPEGVCESAGNHFDSAPLPLFELYLSGVNLRIARDSARASIPAALDLAMAGRVQPRRVVTEVYDWEQLPDLLPELTTKPVFVRGPVSDTTA